ncbi:unnamed protein product [Soboliphyme baturini]|uniref:OB domain-containing protein n=1 Tax=Soboliphyme baturini TaxID=241478 RepID=A0A183IQ96_9BILA|nr:unnamed protein product [Soboliphyme baturini]
MDSVKGPLRKLFCCELKYARYDAADGQWILKIDGRNVPVLWVWLQGSVKLKGKGRMQVVLSDTTGEVNVIVCSRMEKHITALPFDNWCNLIGELVQPTKLADSAVVSVKAKKLVNVNLSDNPFPKKSWAAQVYDYHQWLKQHAATEDAQ